MNKTLTYTQGVQSLVEEADQTCILQMLILIKLFGKSSGREYNGVKNNGVLRSQRRTTPRLAFQEERPGLSQGEPGDGVLWAGRNSQSKGWEIWQGVCMSIDANLSVVK